MRFARERNPPAGRVWTRDRAFVAARGGAATLETAMSDELNDPLFERLGPILLRVLALISMALIAVPLGLVVVVPFFG